VDLLLRAFDAVCEDHGIRLGIVGDGPERDRLRKLAADLGLRERVDFLGFVEDHDEVLAQMRAATVFCSPSTREGFGITVVEAMAAGCAVVAADHPESAVGEVVGDAGILVEPTVEGVDRGLRRALVDGPAPLSPEKRAQRYDWDTVADEAAARYAAAGETW
jgi:glycosyltransferase involved in cell wall biosynthesis